MQVHECRFCATKSVKILTFKGHCIYDAKWGASCTSVVPVAASCSCVFCLRHTIAQFSPFRPICFSTWRSETSTCNNVIVSANANHGCCWIRVGEGSGVKFCWPFIFWLTSPPPKKKLFAMFPFHHRLCRLRSRTKHVVSVDPTVTPQFWYLVHTQFWKPVCPTRKDWEFQNEGVPRSVYEGLLTSARPLHVVSCFGLTPHATWPTKSGSVTPLHIPFADQNKWKHVNKEHPMETEL